MLELEVHISAPALLRDLLGCWQKYNLTICTICLETSGLWRPVPLSTFPVMLNLSTQVRIVICAGRVGSVSSSNFKSLLFVSYQILPISLSQNHDSAFSEIRNSGFQLLSRKTGCQLSETKAFQIGVSYCRIFHFFNFSSVDWSYFQIV